MVCVYFTGTAPNLIATRPCETMRKVPETLIPREYDAVAVCISEDFRIFVWVFALSYATAHPCYTHTYPK